MGLVAGEWSWGREALLQISDGQLLSPSVLGIEGRLGSTWLLVGNNLFSSLSRSDAEDEVEPRVTHRVVASTTVVEETTGAPPSPPVQGEHNYGAKYATRSSEEGFGEGAHWRTAISMCSRHHDGKGQSAGPTQNGRDCIDRKWRVEAEAWSGGFSMLLV